MTLTVTDLVVAGGGGGMAARRLGTTRRGITMAMPTTTGPWPTGTTALSRHPDCLKRVGRRALIRVSAGRG